MTANLSTLPLHTDMPSNPLRILDTLVNNLDGMVYRCKHDKQWTMLFVSQGCKALTHYSPAELVGNATISYEMITHPEDRVRVRAEIESAIAEGRRFSLHYRIITRDGEIKWVYERGISVPGEDGNPVIEGFIEDETHSKKVVEALQNAEHYYRNLVENAAVGIFQTTLDGHYISANPTLAKLYGYDTSEQLTQAVQDISHQLYVQPGRRDDFRRLMRDFGEVVNFESEVLRRDGSRIWISENAHIVKDVNGEFVCYEGTVTDITQIKQHHQQLERQANYDTLTGLLNRNLLKSMIEQGIARARRMSYYLTVVFVDLDNFKFINDSLGHAAGDQLLVEIAHRLKNCLRASDTVVRHGGDEFVLVLNDHYRSSTIITLLERILTDVGKPVILSGREFQVGASLGTALFPHDGDDAETLLKHADVAMYSAKNKGRNNFQFYTSEMNRQADERLNLEIAMRSALEQEDFQVYFQPKTDSSQRIIGLEALARWNDPILGPVPPDRFIPIAEETGLIVPLTDIILRKAFHAAAQWNRMLPQPVNVAVNLSPRLFFSEDIVERIIELVQESGAAAHLIELEITESVFLGDSERALHILHELKEFGVSLAMDDFGTGYSSLSYLRRFPLDIIKIDRSLVTGLEREEEIAKIARAVISLGLSLGKTVVAEGVENLAQFNYLSRQGCHEFQGYLISRPLNIHDTEKLLMQNCAQ